MPGPRDVLDPQTGDDSITPDQDSLTPGDDGGYELPVDDELQDGDVIDTPDGGALVVSGDEEQPVDEDFYANLVDELDPQELRNLSARLYDMIKADEEAREKRDKQYAEGLRRTGFTDDAPSGADFDGASRVQHPMIGKAAVDFASHAMKELFPADGPVKDKILGEVTQEKTARAERKTRHLNYQLTEQMPEFRPSLEQLLSQLPLGGVQYLKIFYDTALQRPSCEVIWVDDMLLPANAVSFLAARRKTVRMSVSKYRYDDRVDSGDWVDIDARETGMPPDETKAQKANDKIEGKDIDPYNVDGVRTMYESFTWWELESDRLKPQGVRQAPYCIVLDEFSRGIAAIYRNWDPERAQQSGRVTELEHAVEFPFIPWRGAYPIGLYHLVGQLAVAATGSLRSLLDSALINNTPALLKLKGLLRGGQIQNIDPTHINELEGTVNNDDIRKLAMPVPFNPPSAVLFQLLGFLSEQGADMVRTALEEQSSDTSNTPVGTTLARIEQGMIVFSAIHARLHASMARVLKILHRIDRDHLNDEETREDTGEVLAYRQDYEGPMDVVPVSDPNIFSEAQRFAQTQAIAQRAANNPLYDQNKVEQRILDTLKIPNPDDLLVTPPNPEPQDPVTENVVMTLGRHAVAFPNQDHVAHLGVHLSYALDPNLGGGELLAPGLVPNLLQHCKEHVAFLYSKTMGDTVARAANVPIEQLTKSKDPQHADALARAFVVASRYVDEPNGEMSNTFGQITQQLGRLIQLAKKFSAQSQPPDPNMVAAQAAAAEVQRKAQKDQLDARLEAGKAQAEQAKLGAEAQLAQADLAQRQAETQSEREAAALAAEQARGEQRIEAAKVDQGAQKLEQDDRLGRLKLAVQQAMNQADNEMAFRIAIMELAKTQDSKSSVSTGTGLNKNPQPR